MDINADIIMKMINENKTVTFNGQINPKYGWAVIMAGGAGVGKTTTIRDHLPIQGKIISSDFFKELYADRVNAEQSPNWKGKKIFSQNDIFLNGEDSSHESLYKNKHNKPFKRREGQVIWDLRQPIDAAEINRVEGNGYDYSHNFLEKQRNFLSLGNTNSKYLPNLIFDMAGAKGDTLNKTFEFLNSFKSNGNGYNIALVWVVANRKVAYASMLNRDRLVPDDAFHKGHTKVNGNDGVIKTLKKYSNIINEAWIIFNSTFDSTPEGRIDRRLTPEEKKSSVVKLEKVNGKFIIPSSFNAMGKKNIELKDIQGHSVAGMGRKNPLEGEDTDYKIFPTSKSAKDYANSHNGRYIKNVDVFDNAKEREQANQQKLNNYAQGKMGTRHISLTENILRQIIRESLKEIINKEYYAKKIFK